MIKRVTSSLFDFFSKKRYYGDDVYFAVADRYPYGSGCIRISDVFYGNKSIGE